MINENIQIGTLLDGRYEIIEKIGTGGMAEVYKAKCLLLNRLVAIKALKSEFSGDEDFVHRFEVEAQAAASLSHPNIVSVYDVGTGFGRHYIVMELAEGITLKEYIAKNGPLEWREAAAFAAQICSGLECAHKKGIIHRDIKPHNIIVTKNGVAKVTDFGIARAATSSTMVADSSVIGSAHYLSPEQARGGYTDAKTDIYSVGITLYEMLTGRVPFDSESAVSVAMMHVSQKPASPRDINPQIPEDIEKITLKAMSKEQNMRYQSAGEMVEDINAALANLPISVYDDFDDVKTPDAEGDNMSKHKRSAAKTKKRKKSGKAKIAYTKSEKRMIAFAVLAAIVLLGIVGIAFMSFFGGFGSSQWDETVVPAIEGQKLEDAQKLLKKAKLEIDIEEQIASVQYEKDIIISQEPAAERSVKKGSKVRVKVSVGIGAQVLVPNVVSYEKENAKATLENAGFVVVMTEEESETVPVSSVIRQIPGPGSEAKTGDTVRLYISTKIKPEQASVPNVIGKSLAQAKNDIEAAGFVVGNVAEVESDKSVGSVIEQSPRANEMADKKSAIALNVSKGTSATPTPAPKVKTISLPVPQNKEATQIRIVANGKQIHDALHHKNEISFDIQVTGRSTATLEIYHDSNLVGTQTINF
ncbi:MAG: Stk1 family PASTA domain-containing Ser/Thr kinase [Ruminococcaceae bacterium]|nr:Stk1 family PASTA domain-containing Ser/Thr kinase [Oscillospiraceae bacterium]